MISIGLDETLFIQLFLLIVVIIMAKFLYLNPVKATIESRDEKIKQLKLTADSGLASVEDSKKAYEEKLVAVRAEMSAYQIKMKDEAAKEVEAIIADAFSFFSKSTDVSRNELKQSYEAAKQTLQKEVKDISEIIYKTISGNVA